VAHDLTILVNGTSRDAVEFATTRPILGMSHLSLRFEPPCSLKMAASDSDYSEGAYRFRAWQWHPAEPGRFRVAAISIWYMDGTSTAIPVLEDEIIVEVGPIVKQDTVPVFTAR
jgi:hypothetical protein